MPKPAHVEAFEFITEGTQNDIKDYVAFGLFMRSENNWASGKDSPPTDNEYRRYHGAILTPYERERYRTGATQVLQDFAVKAIQAERTALLASPQISTLRHPGSNFGRLPLDFTSYRPYRLGSERRN